MIKKLFLLLMLAGTTAFAQKKSIILTLNDSTLIAVKKYDLLEFGINVKPTVGKQRHVNYVAIKEMKIVGVSEEADGTYHYVRFGEPKEEVLPNGRKRRTRKDKRPGALMRLLHDGMAKLYEDTQKVNTGKGTNGLPTYKTQVTRYIKEGVYDPVSVKGKREVLAFFKKCPEVASKMGTRFRLNEITEYLDLYNEHCAPKG